MRRRSHPVSERNWRPSFRKPAFSHSRRRLHARPDGTRLTRMRRNGTTSRGLPVSVVRSSRRWRPDMSEHLIKMPDVGEGIAEAELVEWHVKVGDLVREDALLAAVMTDKATVEIPSPVDGEVLWLGADIGDVVAIGSPLIRLKTGDEAGAASGGDEVDKAPEQPARPKDIEAQADGAVKTSEAVVEKQAREAPRPQPVEAPQSPSVRVHRPPVPRMEGDK